MKKILLSLVSVFVIGCEHDDCHDHCYYRDCDYDYYPPPRPGRIYDVRGYLEQHKHDVPSADYHRYFSQYFDVYGPVYCSAANPYNGKMRLEPFVKNHVNLDYDYDFIYSYTRFVYPPTGEQYYIVEYYK